MRKLLVLSVLAFTLLAGCDKRVYYKGVVVSKRIEAGVCVVRLRGEDGKERSFWVNSVDYALAEVGDKMRLPYEVLDNE